MNVCKREGCENEVDDNKSYCCSNCRKRAHEQRQRKIEKRLTQVKCARYGCTEYFVPKHINHRFHAASCSEQASREKQYLLAMDSLEEDLDPVDVQARRDKLVLEVERERQTVMRRLLVSEARTEVVVAETRRILTAPEFKLPLFDAQEWDSAGLGRPTHAFLCFSDLQAGKWENGIGLQVLLDEYIPAVIKKVMKCVRVQRYEGAVDDFTLALLGDLIENCIIYAGQRQYLDRYNNGDSTVDQVFVLFKALSEMIRILRPNFKRFKVVNAFGNHGRTSKKDDPNLSKDNYDRLVAMLLRESLSDMDIEFDVPETDRFITRAYDWRIGGLHGHQIKNAGSLNQAELTLLRWDSHQHFGAPIDVLVLGHRHHAASLDVNGIEVIQNAAMDGGSSYFTEVTGKKASPSQELLFFSDRYGIDSRHRIYLDERKPRATKLLETLG